MRPAGRRLLLAATAGTLTLAVLLAWGCRTRQATGSPPPAASGTGAPPLAGGERAQASPPRAAAPGEGELVLAADVSVLAMDLTESDLGEILPLPAVVLYFSTSCPHCWNVAPEFQQACERLEPEGVSCLGVVSSSSRLGDARDFAAHTGLQVPLVSDYAGRYRDAHGMTATPTAVLFDDDGRAAFVADPFYGGASLALEMAAATMQGRDPARAWRPGEYVGARACAPCHEVAYNSWLLSPHSVAIMRMPGETYLDPACLRCHATATGEPGGFVDLVQTRHLRDVGCEACHGPGGGHRRDGSVAPGDPTATCLRCHDADHSIAADLPAMVATIDHQLAATLPRDRWGARRLELEEGLAPRVALQIPRGECVGSDACRDCHEDEHRAWAAGPHGTAMETLREAGSDQDPACVVCHRALEPCGGEGPGATEPGVSCEACHGAGAAHLAGGEGDGPITGLRRGHAAECVVEPTCRTCHTKLRDAGWELQERLAGVHPTGATPPAAPAVEPSEATPPGTP